MSWRKTLILSILAVTIASGCAPRRADIAVPSSPPPRAVAPQAQWPEVPPEPRTYQVPPREPVAPYTSPIPNPRVARLPSQPNPNPDFPPLSPTPSTPPSAPEVDVSSPPSDLQGPETRPETSDDYATLIGDGDPMADEAPEVDTDTDDPEPAPGPEAGSGPTGEVLVALLVPETDKRPSVRQLADGLAKAASLASADLDEPRLVLRKYDTGGDPRKAAEAAKNALADGAKLIIGPLFSGSASAVRPVAQAQGVSTIAFTTDDSVLGSGLYSIGFLPQTDIDRIISFSARQGLTQIAALAPDTPYGRVIYDQSRAAASRSGASIVRVQPFKPDFREMDNTAKAFAEFYKKAPKVDAILLATNGKTLQGLSSYLTYRKVLPTKVRYLGLGLWDEPETLREPALVGGWFPGLDPALKADFSARYTAAYSAAPPPIALLGYDAVAVAASLLRTESGANPFTARAIQQPAGYTGMSGLFRFRSDGRNDRALSILEVGRQEFRVIQRAPAQFGQQVTSRTGG